MNLFKSKIIPSSVNAGWADDLPLLADVTPRPMLVLTTPFLAGSIEETTLTNMLKACGFGAEDFNLIQSDEDSPLPWPRVREAAAPKHALLLGVQPAQLSIAVHLPVGQASEFGGVIFIPALALHNLASDEAARKALWTDVLKPMFKAG